MGKKSGAVSMVLYLFDTPSTGAEASGNPFSGLRQTP
jgi:hypothetical protein